MEDVENLRGMVEEVKRHFKELLSEQDRAELSAVSRTLSVVSACIADTYAEIPAVFTPAGVKVTLMPDNQVYDFWLEEKSVDYGYVKSAIVQRAQEIVKRCISRLVAILNVDVIRRLLELQDRINEIERRLDDDYDP